MSKARIDAELYNTILFYLWDVSTGGATSKPQAYKGAKRFARFLLSEIERRNQLVEDGETAVVRRGLEMPNFLINAWAYNIIEDCFEFRIPPPELCEVFYQQLGCTMSSEGRESKPQAHKRADSMLRGLPGMSIRQIAREVEVNPSTVWKWKEQLPDEEFDHERYTELRQITRVNDFYGRVPGRGVRALSLRLSPPVEVTGSFRG